MNDQIHFRAETIEDDRYKHEGGSALYNRSVDMRENMARPGGGPGGLPWFPRNSTYKNPSPVRPYEPTEPYQESDWQGPEQATGTGGGGMALGTLIPLLLAGGSAIGNLFAPRNNQGPSSQTNDPAIQEMIRAQMARLNKSEPLYDAIIRMAGGLMPTQYQPTWGGGSSAGSPTVPPNPVEPQR